MSDSGVHVFDLTPLTRRLASERRTAVVGFDLPTQTVKLAIPAAVAGAIVAGMLSKLLGVYTVLPGVAVGFAVYLLLSGRTKSGLRLRYYQAFLDKRRARNVITVCWQPMVTGTPKITTISPGSVDLEHNERPLLSV